MGYFSLKDTNGNGSPSLYFEIYSSVNYKKQVQKNKRANGFNYQTMSRNHIAISLGKYKPPLNKTKLKQSVMTRAQELFKRGLISEEDLIKLEVEFVVTKGDEKEMYESYAVIQFRCFFQKEEVFRFMSEMNEEDHKEANLHNQTPLAWAEQTYLQVIDGIYAHIQDEMDIGINRAKREYMYHMFEKYGDMFKIYDKGLHNAVQEKFQSEQGT